MPNWGLLNQDNALSYFQTGMQMGDNLRKRREEGEVKNALAAYAANPDDPKALAGVIEKRPELGIRLRDGAREQAAAQRKIQTEQTQQTAAILRQVKADPSRYPMARQAAIQLGIPAASIPEQYDPQWVDQQDMIFSAFEKDGGESLTSAMKHVKGLGYDLNTPAGKSVLAQIVNGNSAKNYVDEQGRTRLYTGFNVQPAGGQAPAAPQGAPQAPQTGEQPFTFDMFKGYRDTQGDKKAAEYIRKFNYRVSVQSPDQARQLPSGTPITLPDGTEGVVP